MHIKVLNTKTDEIRETTIDMDGSRTSLTRLGRLIYETDGFSPGDILEIQATRSD